MSHVAPPRPGRRRSLLVGSVLIVVGVLAAVFAIISLGHPHGRQAASEQTGTRTITISSTPGSTPSSPPASSSSSSSSKSSSSSSSPSDSVPHADVYILNNSTRDGLAARTATAFRAKGWKVVGTATYSNTILSSCAYYDPSNAKNLRAALSLQGEFPGIKRVQPRFAELPGYPIVVVLNADYPG